MPHDAGWTKLATDLERLLKLRSIPFGMKLFENREEMEAIPRIRRPKAVHTLDQVVAQAARLGWTVGITSEDLVGAQCRAVVGLGLQRTRNGAPASTWSASGTARPKTRSAHQAAMECVPDGRYEALAVAPLASGRLDPPDIALFYATPGAMIYFINGLQWSGYKRFDWSIVGEFGVRRFLGPRPEDPAAQPVDPVLCRAPLRRRARRRDADGACRPTISPRRSPAWRRSPRTACAIPSRNTASSRMCAPAWRSAIRAEAG